MDEDPREAKRMRLTSRTVTITVGHSAEPFTIHEGVLQDRSDFFKGAPSKYWKEGATGKIELPEDDPKTVAAYFDWLYSSTVTSRSLAEEKSKAGVDVEFEALTRMYVFGEKVLDNRFCNAVMGTFVRRMQDRFANHVYLFCGSRLVKMIYEGTSVGSPARQMCIDLWTERGGSVWIDEGEKEHPDFLKDLVKSLLDRRVRPQHAPKPMMRPAWLKDE